MRDPEDLENDVEDLESNVKVLTEHVDQLSRHLTFLLERVERLEKVTGQNCSAFHPPLDAIDWPSHCHVRRCPVCGRSYPI